MITKKAPIAKPSALLAALVLLVTGYIVGNAGLTFASVTDAGTYLPPDYTTYRPPAPGGSYTDPIFGTAIKRITDAMHTPDASRGGMVTTISNEYSSMSAFNNDNTRLLLNHFSYFVLYDGAGNFIKNLLEYRITSSSEPRWSRTDPNVFYYVAGNQLKQFNVGTYTSSVVHTFGEYGRVSGMGESDISFDGNYFVLAGDSRYIFVYNISNDTKGSVLDAGTHGFDQVYITPDNNVLVGFYANGSGRFNGVELYDKNMTFLRQIAHAIGHMDVTRDSTGEEVAVWANAADAQLQVPCEAGVTKIRLSDAKQTCVWKGKWTWHVALHISAPDNSGWFFMETYAPSDPIPPSGWYPYTNEILQVKLDGTEIRRLAHHHSRPFDSYVYQPKVSTNRQGTKLVYASNFGLQSILSYPRTYSDAYMIDLAATGAAPSEPETSGGTSGSTPPPETTPPAESAPLPEGTPPASTPTAPTTPTATGPLTRIEQNAGVVAYAGAWNSNVRSAHSGGSAALAMTAGYRATVAFEGTGASWIAYTDRWSGIAKVYVDGALKGEVDTYSSQDKAQFKIYTVTDLPAGSHTLAIEVAGRRNSSSAGNWVWVDAFEVISSGTVPPAAPTEPLSPVPVAITWSNPADITYGTPLGAAQLNASASVNGLSVAGSFAFTPAAGAILNAGTGNILHADFTPLDAANYTAASMEVVINVLKAGQTITFGPLNDRMYGDAPFNVIGTASSTLPVSFSAAGSCTVSGVTVTITGEGVCTVTAQQTGNGNYLAAADVSQSFKIAQASATIEQASALYRVDQSNARVLYSGTWFSNNSTIHSGGSAKLAMDVGSKASFTFNGTQVTWVANRDQWSGVANVYIDGTLVAMLDTYSPFSQAKTAMYTATGLAWGTHTITVDVVSYKSANSSGKWVWIDAFDYVGEP